MNALQPPTSRCDATTYFALAEEGLIAPDERTELLDGVIVAMPPQSPLHAAAVYRVETVLRGVFPPGTVIRPQMSLFADMDSVPEPDIAVIEGDEVDFVTRHPSTALLVVEVAVSTAAQDRLTKSRIYAAAAVKNYWIVKPDEEWVEVYRDVRPAMRAYASGNRFEPGDLLQLDGAPGITIAATELFPGRLRR